MAKAAADESKAQVSIPTRRLGRMLRPAEDTPGAAQCFNPHPAVRPDAAVMVRMPSYILLSVSIPTRRLGRMLPALSAGSPREGRFQSPPGG